MNCKQFRKLISPLLDGELQGWLLEGARAHQTACADCANEFAEMARLRARLGEGSTLSGPEGRWSELQAALLREAVRARARVWRGPVLATAGLLAGLLLGAFAFPRTEVVVRTKMVRVPVEVAVAQPASAPAVKTVTRVRWVKRIKYVRVPAPSVAPAAPQPAIALTAPGQSIVAEQGPKQVEFDPGIVIPVEPGQALTYDIGWGPPSQSLSGEPSAGG